MPTISTPSSDGVFIEIGERVFKKPTSPQKLSLNTFSIGRLILLFTQK